MESQFRGTSGNLDMVWQYAVAPCYNDLQMKTEFKHIVRDEGGRLRIEGTNLKVLELVMACQAHGWSPQEYHLQHPDIGMAQIHAALAYYYDHQTEMDKEIRDDLTWLESEHERNLRETSDIRERLRRLRQKSA